MRSLGLVLALLTPAAHGQWGIGSALGNTCPYNYGPANGAFNNSDGVRNLSDQFARADYQLRLKRNRLARIDRDLNEAKRDMKRVLSQRVIDVITEHRVYNRGPNSYQRNCPAGYGASSGARMPGRGGVDPNFPPTPGEFCYTRNGEQVNTWLENFAMNEGQVAETICNYKIPGWAIPTSQDSSICRRGLKEYDNLIADKVNVEQEIAELDGQMRSFRRQAEDIAEGRPCTNCMAQQRGFSTIGGTDQTVGLAGVAIMAGLAMMTRNNQPRPMFGGGMPMAHGGGFPGQPYAARIPGYMNVGPGGVYGGASGGIGPGSFGCQGTNPMMAGNGFAPPVNPNLVSPYLANPMLSGNPALMGNPAMAGGPFTNPLFAGQPGAFGQPNLFSNPFSTPFMNPGFQNPLMNNGYGPGFMPVLGNGIPGYQMYNPLAQLYNQNAFAPAMLPMQGGSPFNTNPMYQHPYFNQGYQFNPLYNPFGNNGLYGGNGAFNPYGNGGYDPYGGMYGPFGGMYGPYGNNMYGMNNAMAPPMLPMMGNQYSIPYGGGIPGYQMPAMNNYGAPYGSPLGNYNMQMDMLNRNIQMIGAGGAWNPNAPAILPLPGANAAPYYRQPPIQPIQPIQPGLPMQPQPLPLPGPRPPVSPPPPPSPPPTGPIRTR